MRESEVQIYSIGIFRRVCADRGRTEWADFAERHLRVDRWASLQGVGYSGFERHSRKDQRRSAKRVCIGGIRRRISGETERTGSCGYSWRLRRGCRFCMSTTARATMRRRSSLLLLLVVVLCWGSMRGQTPAVQNQPPQRKPNTPLSQDSDPVPSPDPDRSAAAAPKAAATPQSGEVTREGGRYTLTANAVRGAAKRFGDRQRGAEYRHADEECLHGVRGRRSADHPWICARGYAGLDRHPDR